MADLSEGGAEEQDVTFTYSVTWKSSLLSFDKRMDKYRKYQFLKQHLEVRGGERLGEIVPRAQPDRAAA